MGSEKYRLKWSKYESNILSAFHSLLETEALSDVTLFCEGQTFKAHRLVLAACSTHFESLFSHAPVNAPMHNQLFVILDGTRADDLQILLQFMYRGEAYLHQDRINSVLRTAEVLQVKGLSEGPKNLEINEKNLASAATAAPASNARMWSPPHEASGPAHRSTVGIMGNVRSSFLRKEPREAVAAAPRASDLHRDLDGSPPPPHHLLRGGAGHAHRSPDHGAFAYPTSRGENFGVYGNAFRGLPTFTGGGAGGRGFPERDRSPDRRYGPPAGGPKEERDDPYDHAPPHRGSGSRSGSVIDRGTPASDKASERGGHTPASSHHTTDRDRDYDQRSSRNSPPSPVATPSSIGKSTPSSFPSDSTSDFARAASSSTFKDRMRRSSDPIEADNVVERGGAGGKFQDYRRDSELLLQRPRSPPNGGRTEDEVANVNQAANLEAFRRIAQAHAERERFLPGAAGVLHGGINAATIAAQGLTGSASDYMRLAMPVRDPDNGDAISGSGTKLRCPFCERTYGYETNLRAHIRQRHQGIRVSCPYCPRTFTRNNTVRRHVAREHRHLGGRIPTKFGSTRVMPDPIRSLGMAHVAAAAQAVHETSRARDRHLSGPEEGSEGNNGGPSPPPSVSTAASAP